MTIKDLMTKSLITVTADDTIEYMQKLLNEYPIHHLLVVNQESLIGVISDRDILRVISPYLNTHVESNKDRFTLTRTAKQIMKRKPITIQINSSIRQAARTLIEHKVSVLPVVNDEKHLVGVLSWKDIMRYIMD